MALALGSEVIVLLDGGHVDMIGEVIGETMEGLVIRLDNGEVIHEDDPRVDTVIDLVVAWEDLIAEAEYDAADDLW